MKAEKLKVIAIGMAWDELSIIDGKVFGIPFNGRSALRYEYTGEGEQCMEIIEKLISNGWKLRKDDGDYELINYSMPELTFFQTGKTIKEVVCNAAYEYFKGEQE